MRTRYTHEITDAELAQIVAERSPSFWTKMDEDAKRTIRELRAMVDTSIESCDEFEAQRSAMECEVSRLRAVLTRIARGDLSPVAAIHEAREALGTK